MNNGVCEYGRCCWKHHPELEAVPVGMHQSMDAFFNLTYEALRIVQKPKLELEKETGESKAHKPLPTPSRAEIHQQCAPSRALRPIISLRKLYALPSPA